MTTIQPIYTPIPQCNPAALTAELRGEIDSAIARVLDGGPYILGPEVEAFETEWAAWCGVGQAVGCASGTDALELILRGLDLPPNSQVVAPSHTAVATICAIARAGHRPMFADVDQISYCLDPASVERCILAAVEAKDPVAAVIGVHLYGHPFEIDALQNLCQSHGLPLIEDASQAHGAGWKGKKVGGFGVAAAFSLYPTKNLGALGDAGVITTNDAAFANRLRSLRQYGWERSAISEEPGVNSRLDPLQAAILRVKLPYLEAHNLRRQAVAATYSHLLKKLRGLSLPVGAVNVEHVFHQYVIQVLDGQRDWLRDQLSLRGIGTLIHYPKAAHQMKAYSVNVQANRDPSGLTSTELLVPQFVSLPMGTHLRDEDVQKVVDSLEEIFVSKGS